MKVLRRFLLVLFVLSLLTSFGRAVETAPQRYDLVVVGGTPGGIACAIRAAREGLQVLLIHHGEHLGGFLTNGGGGWEAPFDGVRSPLYGEMLRRTSDFYRAKYGENSPQHLASMPSRKTNSHLDRAKVEPHVMEKIFDEMMTAEKSLSVRRGWYVSAATRAGARVEAITLRETHGAGQMSVAADIFVDAMYEGDLVAAVDAPSRIGRESRSEYDEPHAGVIYATELPKPPGQPGFPRDAVEGRLKIRYNGHATGPLLPQSTGEGDGSVMSYNFRLVLTKNPANRVKVEKPAHYDPLAREKMSSSSFIPGIPNAILDVPNIVPNLPNDKISWNGGRWVGPHNDYPAGDWATRERISAAYLNSMVSLLWYYQNDPTAPTAQRDYWKDYGLAADEFVDNRHLPYEIYVREARRLVGRYVFTEHDGVVAPGLQRTPIHSDSIAITDWPIDSVACTLRSFAGGHADGVFFLAEEARPAQVPYRTLLPKGVDNLLVPVALSASHVGWGPIRLEPVLVQTGEAAGVAAALAYRQHIAPAALDSQLLIRELIARRFIITFFNDVDFAAAPEAVQALEYFGTQGWFNSYDARPSGPLTAETARIWAGSFGLIAAGSASDPMAVAHQLPNETDAAGVGITATEFSGMLKSSLAGRPDRSAKIDAAMSSLALAGDKPLDRVTACRVALSALFD